MKLNLVKITNSELSRLILISIRLFFRFNATTEFLLYDFRNYFYELTSFHSFKNYFQPYFTTRSTGDFKNVIYFLFKILNINKFLFGFQKIIETKNSIYNLQFRICRTS